MRGARDFGGLELDLAPPNTSMTTNTTNAQAQTWTSNTSSSTDLISTFICSPMLLKLGVELAFLEWAPQGNPGNLD